MTPCLEKNSHFVDYLLKRRCPHELHMENHSDTLTHVLYETRVVFENVCRHDSTNLPNFARNVSHSVRVKRYQKIG